MVRPAYVECLQRGWIADFRLSRRAAQLRRTATPQAGFRRTSCGWVVGLLPFTTAGTAAVGCRRPVNAVFKYATTGGTLMRAWELPRNRVNARMGYVRMGSV